MPWTYDLNDKEKVSWLEGSLKYASVGSTYMVQVSNNPSVGYKYEVQVDPEDVFEVQEIPTKTNAAASLMSLMTGSDIPTYYKLTVKQAGEGTIEFVPKSIRYRVVDPYQPTFKFDSSALA